MNLITLDFETYFDSEYTLKKETVESYVRDPRFKVHCAGYRDALGTSGVVDEPRGMLCAHLRESAVLCHHAQFDGLILSHHYNIKPAFWFDTLSMARLVLPHLKSHSLEALAEHFGLSPKTVPYNEFKGVRGLSPELYNKLAEGAMHDVGLTFQIFKRLLPSVPYEELRVIDATIRMFTEPRLELDTLRMEKFLAGELEKKENALARLGVTRADLHSSAKFVKLLKAAGVEPPGKPSPANPDKMIPALSKNDEGMKELLNHENETVAALAAARIGEKSTLGETRAKRLIEMAGRGALCVYLTYCGAHTTRWSGGDSLNWQNFTRGSEIRKSVMAPEGHMLVIIDLAQIECVAEGQLVATRDRGLVPIQNIGVDDFVWDGIEWVSHEGVICKGEREVITYEGLTATKEHVVYLETGEGMEFAQAAKEGRCLRKARPAYLLYQAPLRKALMSRVLQLWAAWDRVSVPVSAGDGGVGAYFLTPQGLYRIGDRPDRQRGSLRTGQSQAIYKTTKCQQSVNDFLGTVTRWLAFGDAGFQTRLSAMRVWPRPDKNIGAAGVGRRRHTGAFLKWLSIAARQSEKPKKRQEAGQPQVVKRAKVYDIVNAGPRHRFTVSGVLVSNCRVLNWLAGQADILEAFGAGRDIYCDAATRALGRLITKSDKLERQLFKTAELGLGYGMGHAKFETVLKQQGLEGDAAGLVRNYRATHPQVVKLWHTADRILATLETGYHSEGGYFWGPMELKGKKIILPNGAALDYSNLSIEGGEYVTQRRTGAAKMYGAKLVENVIQALSRVVLSQAMIKIAARRRVVLTVHDELVICCKTEEAQDCLAECLQIMKTPPEWAAGLPLDAEGSVSERYSK